MNLIALRIADIRVKLVSEVKGVIERFKEMYYNYIIPDNEEPHVVLEIKCTEMEQYINYEKLPFEKEDIIKTNYIYSSSYNPINKKALLLTNLKNVYPFSEEYLLNLFTDICLQNNKFLFHSSVIYDGDFNAYIFYGPSGIGKSTIVKNSPEYRIVSDDLVVIESVGDNLFKIHKTPFERNKKRDTDQHLYKIKGFFRLNHSNNFKLEELSASQKIASILGNVWNTDFSSDTYNKNIKAIDIHFSSIPAYNLYLKNTSNLNEVIDAQTKIQFKNNS